MWLRLSNAQHQERQEQEQQCCACSFLARTWSENDVKMVWTEMPVVIVGHLDEGLLLGVEVSDNLSCQ